MNTVPQKKKSSKKEHPHKVIPFPTDESRKATVPLPRGLSPDNAGILNVVGELLSVFGLHKGDRVVFDHSRMPVRGELAVLDEGNGQLEIELYLDEKVPAFGTVVGVYREFNGLQLKAA